MAAQAPEIMSPPSRGALASGDVLQGELKFRFRTSTPGATLSTWALRRRRVAPTVGAYEWWNSTTPAWQGTEVYNSGSVSKDVWNSAGDIVEEAALTDGSQMYLSGTQPTFTNGEKYQLTFATKSSGDTVGVYARDVVVDVHARPVLTGGAVTPTSQSFPLISWSVVFARTDIYQQAYQWKVAPNTADYTTSMNDLILGLDADLFFSWVMPDLVYDSQDFSVRPTNPLAGPTSSVYGRVIDSTGLSSKWVKVGQVVLNTLTSLQPSLVTGSRKWNDDATFQFQLSTNVSQVGDPGFLLGLGNWQQEVNCELTLGAVTPSNITPPPTVEPSPTLNELRVEIGGMSYAQLDTAQTTYTATDTAYATYSTMTGTKAAPTDRAIFHSGKSSTAVMYPVTAGTVYRFSALLNRSGASAARAFLMKIKWFTAGGAPSSTPESSHSTSTITSPNQWSAYSIPSSGFTAPGDAAFAAIQIEITDDIDGEVWRWTNFAFAKKDAPEWDGSTLGVLEPYLYVQHSIDGVTWEDVWGCSLDNPQPIDDPNGTVFTVIDRNVPRGIDPMRFRYAVLSQEDADKASWSFLVSAQFVGMGKASGWWLRDTGEIIEHTRIYPANLGEGQETNTEIFSPEGREYPIVVSDSSPRTQTFDQKFMCINQHEADRVLEMLRSGRALLLHRNVGALDPYVVPVGEWSRELMKAAPRKALVPGSGSIFPEDQYRDIRGAYMFSVKFVRVARPANI